VHRATSALLVLLVLLATVQPLAAVEDPQPAVTAAVGETVPGEVVVRWRDGADATSETRGRGLVIAAELGVGRKRGAATLVATRGRAVADVIAELRSDPSVEAVEPNYRVQLAEAVVVNDPLTAGQYSLDQMRVRDAWSLSKGGNGIVAVLDTGVMANHPDLAGRVLPGYDFVNNDANAADDNGHGTWVAGIIAAKANDGYGIAGISWTDKILPVKIMDREGTGSTADLLAGIQWATSHGATVINMSVGGFPYSQLIQDAINDAWNAGIVLVGAAGNNARDEVFYPASFANVVSVSATQVNDEFAHWSSYGSKVDVSAPGASVQTTNCTVCTYAEHNTWGAHTYISGTSFATPNVAGVIALIRARFPTAAPAEVVNRLLTGVDDLGYAGRDNRYGVGRVNALRALGGQSSAAAGSPGDGFEPNNTPGAARVVGLGATVLPTLHPAGDVDTFAVDVPRMGRLEVRVSGVVDSRAYPWNRSTLPIDPIVELLRPDGTLLKRVDAEWESGVELAAISVASATRILVRVTNYYANGNRIAYSMRTAFVDEVPPKLTGLKPAPGSDMAPTPSIITFTMSEPVDGLDASTVTVRTSTGTLLPASVSYDRTTGKVRVTPSALLPPSATIRLTVSSAIHDEVGLPLSGTTYAFSTSPGEGYRPSRRISFAAGTQVGHRFSPTGGVRGLLTLGLATASGASVVQRAAFANLPGDWLYVQSGMFATTWVRESARAHLSGTTELMSLPPSTRLTFKPGTHVARVYSSSGSVVSSVSRRLFSTSGANVDALAVINGVRQYRMASGIFAGRWVAESTLAFRAGFVDRMTLSPARRIRIAAGTHTATAFSTGGVRVGSRTATLSRPSGADVRAWAVANGRAYVLVSSGIWAGYWLPEEAVIAYER